jgi:Cu(I)/Ag(I) efflux system membrane fusion protein
MVIVTVLITAFLSMPAVAAENKEVLYWVAPMDPNYRRDKPGKSPMGMDLVPVYANADDANNGNTVSISPRVTENLGLRTAKAEYGKLWRGIDTVGYINYDETKLSHIHLRVSGWIENLVVRSEGDRVKKDDRLFDLYSPDLVNAQEELVTALNSGRSSLIRASRERLASLGVSDNQIKALVKTKKVQQRISIYASQDGVVASLKVREGMYVKPEMRVLSLADLSSVWLLAEVFERQADWVKVGQLAEVKLSYLPGETWEGKVEYIYPDLDPKTRTLKVRLRFDNPDETLKPNMYANVKIYGGASRDMVFIPTEGLIRTGRDNRVIVALNQSSKDKSDTDNYRFEARDVVVGIESGDYVEIRDGLKAGENVVVSGQFLIDSEASMSASLERMGAVTEDDMATTKEKASGHAVPKGDVFINASGVIRAVDAAQRKLNIRHDPIDALGWPAMTMDFDLADGVDIDKLAAGDSVMFQLEKKDDHYRITSIHKDSDMVDDMANDKR